jgi:hypothetical protein
MRNKSGKKAGIITKIKCGFYEKKCRLVQYRKKDIYTAAMPLQHKAMHCSILKKNEPCSGILPDTGKYTGSLRQKKGLPYIA